jgi:hypothetical protein
LEQIRHLRYVTRRVSRAGNVASRKDGVGVDRCAVFVDAGYLASGAGAMPEARRMNSVSWDYPGLLRLLSDVARERTGHPVLRCYWYEASDDGVRTAAHERLAEIPGLKLRLRRARQGRRDGIEADLKRDLIALARNRAISDVLIVTGDEYVTDTVAEAQDHGVRVAIANVTAAGRRTVGASLRQECDDLVELPVASLRPFLDLSEDAGAVPAAEQAAAVPAVPRAQPGTARHRQPTGPLEPAYAAPVSDEFRQVAAQPPAERNGYAVPAQALVADPAMTQGAAGLGHIGGVNGSPAAARNGTATAQATRNGHPVNGSSAPEPGMGAPNGLAVPGSPVPAAGPGATPAHQAFQPYHAQLAHPAYGGAQWPGADPAPTDQQRLAAGRGPAQGPVNGAASRPAGFAMTEAVRVAQAEGYNFGETVARDAPALWLDAVLARKPRMPSDLEARLLQGSALPIDSLLHDEVRLGLRRGFWDALEGSRR